MLVLARRPNEQIVINGEIVITVLGVGRGGQVRLGIVAPPHVQIFRHELWEQIKAGRGSSASSSGSTDGPPPQPGNGTDP